VVARYQQYRAVHRSAQRMRTRPTRLQAGELDRRGGTLCHTHGPGTSLPMACPARVTRSQPQLTGRQPVPLTDRTQLQEQLAATMELTGESSETIDKVDGLAPTLAAPGKGLYFAMIHKYQDRDAGEPDHDPLDGEEQEPGSGGSEGGKKPLTPQLDVIDESTDILVLVDEAHRS